MVGEEKEYLKDINKNLPKNITKKFIFKKILLQLSKKDMLITLVKAK